jgi:alpha-1,3/alpha-1,6-mannosyltransferase
VPPLRIAFVHPFLRLGGSERLIVDAAAWLRQAGHAVTILTTQHDPARSFEAARDGTLKVRVFGDWLPVQILGRLRAPCTLARMTALSAAATRLRGSFDVAVCDLVSHVVPLVRRAIGCPVLFYCHFPDLLLTPERRSWYRAYRWPLDWLERRGIESADAVLVNSRYTQGIFEQVFPGRRPGVLHPGVECAEYAGIPPVSESGEIVLLSVNRFDSKKNLGLALETLAALRPRLREGVFARVKLVLAGGHDWAFAESTATLDGLREQAARLGLADQVQFVTNATDSERRALLAACRCVLYTPRGEHLGIVPLEAMAAGRPVIAVNEAGPVETVVDGRTGFLCPPEAGAFAERVAVLIEDEELARHIGVAAREHVQANFSRERFGQGFEAELRKLAKNRCS